ncbi:BON domain-containing protein [Sulfitobacter aestuarii]|uniref:BON domain-containing protein n=1 Tax=Sulfitobacter aestuarii TaxID=2161676 RepID=A0ABW5U4R0_9RHOB
MPERDDNPESARNQRSRQTSSPDSRVRGGDSQQPVFDRGRDAYGRGSYDPGSQRRDGAYQAAQPPRDLVEPDRQWGYRPEGYQGSRGRAYEGRPEGFQGGGYQGYEGRVGTLGAWHPDDDSNASAAGRSHQGRGPKNYRRSDTRIYEDVSDRLTEDRHVDASEIEVTVAEREVTLSGLVSSKRAKRQSEDCAESVSGVSHVQNNLRVRDPMADPTPKEAGADSGKSGGAASQRK